jgi:hypothetical protein
VAGRDRPGEQRWLEPAASSVDGQLWRRRSFYPLRRAALGFFSFFFQVVGGVAVEIGTLGVCGNTAARQFEFA